MKNIKEITYNRSFVIEKADCGVLGLRDIVINFSKSKTSDKPVLQSILISSGSKNNQGTYLYPNTGEFMKIRKIISKHIKETYKVF